MIVLIIKIKEKYGVEERYVNTGIYFDGEHRSFDDIEELAAHHIPPDWTLEDYKWQRISDQ